MYIRMTSKKITIVSHYSRPISLISLCCLLLLLFELTYNNVGLGSSVTLVPAEAKRCVHKFNDRDLPIHEALVGDELEFPDLGKIMLMPVEDSQFDKMKPKDCNIIRARFYIYTRLAKDRNITFAPKERFTGELPAGLLPCDGEFENPITPTMPFNLTQLAATGFDYRKRTIILIPGYLTPDKVSWMRHQKRVWLYLMDSNVILVTWSTANQGKYLDAVQNIPFVGRQVTILLHYLLQLNGLKFTDNEARKFLKRIHLIGHSLGAHMAGLVGRDFQGQLGRISGLDPAGPYFENIGDNFRLDRKHARVVDVYHSNMGVMSPVTLICSAIIDHYIDSYIINAMFRTVCKLASNMGIDADPRLPGAWLGIIKSIGHVDYFMNNGQKQPGCFDFSHVCDHGRAVEMVEDALIYESFRREIHDQDDQLDPNLNLIAFRTDHDFENVGRTSHSIGENCSWLMMNPLEAIERHGTFRRDLKPCTLPIDFLSSPSDFRKTLSQKYGVEFSANSQQRNLGYFRTGSRWFMMSDHYIVKLQVGPETRWNKDRCTLAMNVVMDDEPKFNFDTSEYLIRPNLTDEIEPGALLVFPFAGIYNETRIPLIERVIRNPQWLIDEDNANEFKNLSMPTYINIVVLKEEYLVQTKIDNPAQNGEQNSTDPTRKDPDLEDDSTCFLQLDYLMVQPVWSSPRTVYGIYNLEGSGSDWLNFDALFSSLFRPNHPRHRVELEENHYGIATLRVLYIDDKLD